MTYAGLKSMIYAGVTADDPRVKAAVKWLQINYDLSSNPGMGKSGLFYYYHTFAKALDAAGQTGICRRRGRKPRLAGPICSENSSAASGPTALGSNDDPRWLEGDPNLVTGYVLLTLSYCKPAVK